MKRFLTMVLAGSMIISSIGGAGVQASAKSKSKPSLGTKKITMWKDDVKDIYVYGGKVKKPKK